VLDLAAGSGRHTRLLLDMGLWVTAVDRDIAALKELAGARCTVREIDLENGEARTLGGEYDGIVVTNYLHRPLFPALKAALAPGGIAVLAGLLPRQEPFVLAAHRAQHLSLERRLVIEGWSTLVLRSGS